MRATAGFPMDSVFDRINLTSGLETAEVLE